MYLRYCMFISQICEYDWSKVSEYHSIVEAHALTAPSYADINRRLAEARAALGVDSAGTCFMDQLFETSDKAASTEAAAVTDAVARSSTRPAKRSQRGRFAGLAPELVPVGNAPFDKF